MLDMAATTSPVVWGFLAGTVLPLVARYWMTPPSKGVTNLHSCPAKKEEEKGVCV
jgi:hypothetical protein